MSVPDALARFSARFPERAASMTARLLQTIEQSYTHELGGYEEAETTAAVLSAMRLLQETEVVRTFQAGARHLQAVPDPEVSP
jgi:hypothetical protein